MIIGIDSRFAIHNRRGIGNYTLKLIQNIALIDHNNKYILYIDKKDEEGVLPQQDNFEIKRFGPSNYFLWEQIILPFEAKKDVVDILHCTGNTAPIFLDKRIMLISSIMDVMYLKDYSELPKSTSAYQRMGRLYRKVIVPRTAGRLSKALTISEFSKSDIIKHLPKLNHEKIKVVYLAANESYRHLNKASASRKLKDRFGIKGDYIMALGAVDPRKNTEFIINKFLELKREQNLKEQFLIVGIPNWKQTKFYNLVRESNSKDDILFADFVSEDDLVFLYNGATLFLYPSLYEGFGIPPLEAMACGTPVITSNTTSIPEVVADAAFLINPQNGEELKSALLKLLHDENLRNTLRTRGLEQAKKFSWMKTAEDTLAIYQQVYRENKKAWGHSES